VNRPKVEATDTERAAGAPGARRRSPTTDAPHVGSEATILRLQRLVGNRAVTSMLDPVAASIDRSPQTGRAPYVQRLIYEQSDKTLLASEGYGNQRVPWDAEKGVALPRDPAGTDPTLLSLYTAQADTFNAYLAATVGEVVERARFVAPASYQTVLGSMVGFRPQDKDVPYTEEEKATAKSVGAELARTLARDNMFIPRYRGVTFWKPSDVTESMLPAMRLTDVIAQEPDLPGKGTSVRSPKGRDRLAGTYWEYVCVLIALVKHEGYPAVKSKTKAAATINSLDTAVQALHDYYIGKGIQYDDSATRRKVMDEWGYKLIFSGPIAFSDLRRNIALPLGKKYIFDITGHTVKVDLKAPVPKDDQPTDPNAFLTFRSEPDNYNLSEVAQELLYIFAKDG
jgi:hypothetical protein